MSKPTPPPSMIDSAPSTAEEFRLEYAGYWGCSCVCRVRVYRPNERPAVLLLTELPENAGTSITNAAEWVYYQAWERAGAPHPVTFIEHYPGEHVRLGPLHEEHFDVVLFPQSAPGGPAFSSRWDAARQMEMTTFGEPAWRRLDREALLGLIGGES